MAGAMNAIAGGGTFFSFPAMLMAGVPPVTANASNSVALWPASLSSAWAYRHEAMRHGRWAVLLAILSIIGGLVGGLLLLAISNQTFMRLVPWLLLVATTLFALSTQVSRIIRWLKQRLNIAVSERPGSIGGALFQLMVAIYGGFFGAGSYFAVELEYATRYAMMQVRTSWAQQHMNRSSRFHAGAVCQRRVPRHPVRGERGVRLRGHARQRLPRG